MKEFLDFLVDFNSIFLAIFGISVYKSLTIFYKKQKENQDNIKKGILTILHSILYKECKKYIAEKYITVDEFNDLNYLYKAYRNLGGNGIVEKMHEKISIMINEKGDENCE